MRKLALVIVIVCFSFAGLFVAYAGEYQFAPYTGSKEFERMKQLAGAWEGTSDMGKEGEIGGQVLNYKILFIYDDP